MTENVSLNKKFKFQKKNKKKLLNSGLDFDKK